MQAWSPLSDAVNAHGHEKNGVTYLIALNKMTTALVDAESSAVAGNSVSRGALSSATEGVTAVNAQFGAELGADQRWATLRSKIEALSARSPATPAVAFTAYTEVTDLMGGLYSRVRARSGLDRDPNAVAFYLQDAATLRLPQILIRAGRYNDLAVLTSQRPVGPAPSASARPNLGSDSVAASVTAALASYRFQISESLVGAKDDFTAIVDTGSNDALSTTVLHQFDSFQRTADTIVAPPAAVAGGGLVNSIIVTKQRNETEWSAVYLANNLTEALNALVVTQENDAQTHRTWAVVAFALALILLIGGYVVGRIASLRGSGRRGNGATGSRQRGNGTVGGRKRGDGLADSVDRQPSLPAGVPVAAGSHRMDEYGRPQATGWEWSDAPR